MTQDTSSVPNGGDIEIELHVETLSTHFLISPNDLHRARGDWNGLTFRARALLSALLTMRTGFVMSRGAIDALDPSLGRKAMNTVITELKERGFIVATRSNGDDGRFRWRWSVYLRPHHVYAGRAMDPSGDDGEPTMDPSGDDGSDQEKHDVCAGRTMGPSTIDGSGTPIRRPVPKNTREEPPSLDSMDGKPADDEQEEEEEEEGKEKETDYDHERLDDARTVLRRVTTGLPAAKMPTDRQAGHLVSLAVDALHRGWTSSDLVRRVGDGDLTKVDSVYAVLQYRFSQLGAPVLAAVSTSTERPSEQRNDYDWRVRRQEADPKVVGVAMKHMRSIPSRRVDTGTRAR